MLLHGGWEDSRWWRLQLESLAHEYTVIAWDAPGCGRSDDPPEGVRLGYYSDTLAGLIRELGIEHPHAGRRRPIPAEVRVSPLRRRVGRRAGLRPPAGC
ncbi:alpha/beta fold hydrolase [Nocardia sp. CA-135953]|uniref:alpha/beta fold hydrolase n=1 Tax=Nocardia sp. CA-135953 TaxID=3239978 RepID=UPI003D95B0A2